MIGFWFRNLVHPTHTKKDLEDFLPFLHGEIEAFLSYQLDRHRTSYQGL